MFDQPRWQALKLKRVRYIVPWDYSKDRRPARRGRRLHERAPAPPSQDVLVTFTARRGCYNGRPLLEDEGLPRAERAGLQDGVPARSTSAYPWVKTYSAWNEVNHVSQPTSKSPKLAARYYDVLRKYTRTRKFKVDGRRRARPAQRRALPARVHALLAKGSPRLWGLHNYEDVNRQPSRAYTSDAADRPGRGLADRDRRHREVRCRSFKRSTVARRVAHEVHVQAGRPLRHQAARAALEDHAAVRLPLVRRAARARASTPAS